MKVIKRITSVVLSLIFCFGFAATCMADTLLSTQQAALSKIAPEITQAFEDGAKKVPVYIWLTDINQDSVEAEVKQKTGLTRDTLSVSTETISSELAQAITDESTRGFSEKTTTEFNSYLERTAQARELERINTDTYISERRAVARSKIEAKNTAFVTSAEISESSIIFQSAYAPMIIAELSEYQVQMLAGRMDVELIEIYKESNIKSFSDDIVVGADDLIDWRSSTDITKTKNAFNVSGEGVDIGIVEAYNITHGEEFSTDRFINVLDHDNDIMESDTSLHEEYVTMLCAGTDGIANESTVYIVSANEYGYDQAVELLIELNVDVINSSVGPPDVTDNYSSHERYVDYLVVTHNVIFAQAAGNATGTQIVCPGLADNVITVGGYDNYFSSDVQDDQMYAYVYEENGGCEKPDIVAPANAPWDEGTSYATPYVSGSIALLLELKPSLASRPEVVKAIVLASCHRKVKPAPNDETPELIEDGLTEKQGAGAFDPYIALSIVAHETYGVRVMAGDETEIEVSFIQPRYDSAGMNVSIAWLRQNRKNILNIIAAVDREDFDIDLWNNSNRIDDSFEVNSSTEMIYHSFAGVTSDLYTLEIRKYQGNGNDTRIGYAWSVSNACKQDGENGEGIYLLRNVANGLYLQANSETGAVTQNEFTGDPSQMWVIKQQLPDTVFSNVYWNVRNGKNINANLSCIVSNTNGYLVSTTNNNTTVIGSPYSGSVNAFMISIDDQPCALGISSESELTAVRWIPVENVENLTDYQLWYMEPCAYQLYDANIDGSISAADARFLLRCSVELETANAVQQYLGDINKDNTISAADARLALRYSVGLID